MANITTFSTYNAFSQIASEHYQECMKNYSQHDAIIAVLFEALAVEAFINFYGSEKLGHAYFRDHIDCLSTINKYIVVTRLVKDSEFPKSNHVFSLLKELMSTRNNLVHSKSIEVDLDLGFESFSNCLSLMYGNGKKDIYDIAGNVIGLCDKLIKVIDEL